MDAANANTPTAAGVAAGHPRATEAAVSILEAGGSAVDAAIAADAVMGVIEPTGTGIGGDALIVVADREGTVGLNGSGRSASALDLASIPPNDSGYIESVGGLAATVPGAVAAWWDLHQQFGTTPWAEVLAPAIAAAADGAPVGNATSRGWGIGAARLSEQGKQLYLSGGEAPAAGATWRNPALAALLGQIASDGPDAFYAGPMAEATARAARDAGGVLDSSDLAAHASAWVDPLTVQIDDWELATLPPNCQGVVMALAADQLHRSGHLSASPTPDTTVALAAALDRSFSAAVELVADPEVVDRSVIRWVPRRNRRASLVRPDAQRPWHRVHSRRCTGSARGPDLERV